MYACMFRTGNETVIRQSENNFETTLLGNVKQEVELYGTRRRVTAKIKRTIILVLC